MTENLGNSDGLLLNTRDLFEAKLETKLDYVVVSLLNFYKKFQPWKKIGLRIFFA